jgi:hypothetical protein
LREKSGKFSNLNFKRIEKRSILDENEVEMSSSEESSENLRSESDEKAWILDENETKKPIFATTDSVMRTTTSKSHRNKKPPRSFNVWKQWPECEHTFKEVQVQGNCSASWAVSCGFCGFLCNVQLFVLLNSILCN